jgi:2-polyprenyl-6-methoxyphenol hydroxylase-like FAD-dependent oxidoreductase
MFNTNTDVLIVGAGPTGLVLGLWLTLLGVRVRIVDKTEQPGTTSRALAVQARTLELYRQVGIADAVVAAGRPMGAVNSGPPANTSHTHRGYGAGISPFPTL